MLQQMLLAGGLIEPSIAIGGLAFTDTDTRTYSGNGSYVTMSDDTYNIPNNWQTKQWTYKVQITSSASYICIGYSVIVYHNGMQVASWSQPGSNASWFRYNTGTRTHTHTLNLAKGDTLRGYVRILGRNVGGTTPSTTNYHELKRIT